jgi:hypothetical protein
MIDKIKKLEISVLDKIKAMNIIKDHEYGYEYLEDLLCICFLIIPSFYDRLSSTNL